MPKALFFSIPAHGHVNPSLPLVAELVRRGRQLPPAKDGWFPARKFL